MNWGCSLWTGQKAHPKGDLTAHWSTFTLPKVNGQHSPVCARTFEGDYVGSGMCTEASSYASAAWELSPSYRVLVVQWLNSPLFVVQGFIKVTNPQKLGCPFYIVATGLPRGGAGQGQQNLSGLEADGHLQVLAEGPVDCLRGSVAERRLPLLQRAAVHSGLGRISHPIRVEVELRVGYDKEVRVAGGPVKVPRLPSHDGALPQRRPPFPRGSTQPPALRLGLVRNPHVLTNF